MGVHKNKAIALQEQIVLSVGRFFFLFQPSIASALGIIPLPLHRYRLMKQDGADDNPIRTPRFLHTYQRLDIRNIYKIQSILSPLSFSLSQLLILSFLNVMHIKHYQRYKRLTYHFLNTRSHSKRLTGKSFKKLYITCISLKLICYINKTLRYFTLYFDILIKFISQFSSFAEERDILMHTCQNVLILDIHPNKRGDTVFVNSSKTLH